MILVDGNPLISTTGSESCPLIMTSNRVFTLDVTTNIGSFILGSDAPTTVTIGWGDGYVEDVVVNGDTTLTHTYVSNGLFAISMVVFRGFSFC